MKKKIISILLSIILIIGICPIQSFGADTNSSDFRYQVIDGKIKITSYLGNSKDLSVPAYIDSMPVTVLGKHTFYNNDNLYKITFPDTLEEIEEETFYDCPYVNDLIIPENVKKVGNRAFYGCFYIPKITFKNKNIVLGEDILRGCPNVTIEGYTNSTAHVYALNNNIRYALIPELEPSQADFRYWKYAQGVTIVGFKGIGSVAEVPEMIDGLPVVNLGDGQYAPFEMNISGKSYQIKKIIIPSTVRYITEHAFYGNFGIEEIIIKDGANFGLKNTKEKTVVDWYVIDSLKKISLGNAMTDISMDIFYGDSLETIHVSDGNPKYSSQDGILYNQDKTELIMCGSANPVKEIHIPNTVKKISDYAFQNCTKIEKIYIPASVESFGHDPFSGTSAKLISEKDSQSSTTVTPANQNPTTPIVTKKPVKVKKLTLSGISKKIAVGKKVTLKTTVSPSNATNKKLTWKSSNTKVATVNSKGVVTIKKKTGGKTVTITATAKDGSGKKATYKINVMKGVVKKVTISGNKPVKAGKTLKLKAKVTASKGANKKVQWISSNVKYAKVSSSGKVTALKAGKGKKVKITAMATDGSGKKKSVTIKIK